MYRICTETNTAKSPIRHRENSAGGGKRYDVSLREEHGISIQGNKNANPTY